MHTTARGLLAFAIAVPLLCSCGRGQTVGMAQEILPLETKIVDEAEVADAKPQRYLAVRHNITLETPADKVEPLWRQLQVSVTTAGGDVLSAGLMRRHDGQPTASLSLRLPPKQVPALLGSLSKEGELVSSNTETEDKTAAVIDVEARLRNLTEARDQLRKMLAARTGSLSDVLQVQKALTETQSQLDSYAGQRKALANETDMVRVDLDIQPPRSVLERSAIEPLRDAWHSLGHTASSSLAALLMLVVAVLPWLLVLLPLGWGVRKLWRGRKTHKM